MWVSKAVQSCRQLQQSAIQLLQITLSVSPPPEEKLNGLNGRWVRQQLLLTSRYNLMQLHWNYVCSVIRHLLYLVRAVHDPGRLHQHRPPFKTTFLHTS